ncbi:uncharacterized protein LOC143357260 [Halictus rubicundus]|uniref:uncharacterized protein LOC143357260 n=1 Tax=Halictus rubicundus TaxID=77578 RepID=UPI004034F763
MDTRVRRNTRSVRHWGTPRGERPEGLKGALHTDPHQSSGIRKVQVAILGQTLWVCRAKLRENTDTTLAHRVIGSTANLLCHCQLYFPLFMAYPADQQRVALSPNTVSTVFERPIPRALNHPRSYAPIRVQVLVFSRCRVGGKYDGRFNCFLMDIDGR